PTKNPDKEFTYLDVSSVNKETKEIEGATVLLGKDAPSRARKLVRENDVIFATVRPTHSRVALITEEYDGQVCSTGYFVLRGKENIDNKYLFYFLLTDEFNKQMEKLQKGASYPAVTDAEVKSIFLRFPKSLSEQQRIVSILDEAFAAIAKAKAIAEQNLKNAKELFESYLQGVFENGNWEKKELRELTTVLGDGLHGTPKYTIDGDYYFINGNNLNDGKIEFKENTKRVNVDEFNKHKKNLTDRTVLVSINGTLGNVAFYNREKIILGKSACYFNLKETVDKGFVKYVLTSRYFVDYAHREATGATIKNVSLKSMREFQVPLPPLKEQQTIVRQLDALRAETQKLEAVYRKKMDDLEELKKSILQKAFAGELKTEKLETV
ncbi:MAG: restriction endonuclease subunit S, partial [Bacteroidales bacterium]|nr:restriction endonuclease subunit S [Bacteroidales bacterium]